MDLSEFLDVYQPPTSPPMVAKDLQNNNSLISLSQSSINKMLLQVLSPSEDTIKTCLYSDQHKNNETYSILKTVVDLDQKLTTSTYTTRHQIVFTLIQLINSCLISSTTTI
uniref:Uncharacterized protein n=1 Tax=Tetranychus urticae TaxID=32264 RepID=T1L6J7_TETUR